MTTAILTCMPRVANHDERREEIAEAVWRVIEGRGLEGASMREIAREAGYTTGVLSHYFRDKRELLAFAFGLVVDRSTERISRVAGEAGLLDALAELLPLDEGRSREARVWLILVSASLQDPELAAEIRERYGKVREVMAPLFEAAVERSRNGTFDELSGDELLAAVDGITVEALADPERYPPSHQLELLRRAFARLDLPTGPVAEAPDRLS